MMGLYNTGYIQSTCRHNHSDRSSNTSAWEAEEAEEEEASSLHLSQLYS